MLWIFLLLHVASAYHATDELLTRVQDECKHVEQLSCAWQDDMLVVDWNKHKPRDVLWTFNEHARERVTGELALTMIQRLKDMRPTRRITIIPIVNVWGRKRVEAGLTCRRTNRNGVDTNRNYPVQRHHYPLKSEQYEGMTSLSEPETKFIAALLRNHTRMFINIHSGEYALYTPWDASFHLPPDNNRMQTNVQRWSKWCPTCLVGPAATVSNYRAYGTAVDYATTLGVEAYTFEIFGADHSTCERMFNPHSDNLQRVLEPWCNILHNSLDHA